MSIDSGIAHVLVEDTDLGRSSQWAHPTRCMYYRTAELKWCVVWGKSAWARPGVRTGP